MYHFQHVNCQNKCSKWAIWSLYIWGTRMSSKCMCGCFDCTVVIFKTTKNKNSERECDRYVALNCQSMLEFSAYRIVLVIVAVSLIDLCNGNHIQPGPKMETAKNRQDDSLNQMTTFEIVNAVSSFIQTRQIEADNKTH